MPEPTPDAWAQIRHDYEHTDRPIVDICAEHGITDPMLRYRVKRWGWHKRRSLIPREGPPPVAVKQHEIAAPSPAAYAAPDHPTPLSLAHASAVDPPPPGEGEDPASIVPRLQSAVARVLPAIEATIARLAAGPYHAREMEQASRALSSLTRTLRELNALLAQHKSGDADDVPPQDIDAFRDELARRLRGIIAARKQRIEEAKAAET